MNRITLPFNSVWEDFPCELWENYEPDRYESLECVHMTPEGKLPRVLVALNEGGHNSTGICVDCLLDWLRTQGCIDTD